MTDLLKTIKRRTVGRRRDRSTSRAMVVSLEPGDVVGVRMMGTRQTYRISIEGLYELAIRSHLARVDKRARELVKHDGLKMRSALVKARKELAGDLKP